MRAQEQPQSTPDQPDWEALLPSTWYARWGHRCLDGLLLATLLPFALPLMLLVACGNLLVFGDPRQIFFLQPRIGWRGKKFCIVKFRTMKSTSSSALGSWSSGEDHLRVTAFGKFLRNAHLDELPQLFNILSGDMSFIGPRPEMVEIEEWASTEIPGFSHRLAIRPGLAGLAQITQGYTGHDVQAYAEKLAINMNYMRSMSLGFDLRIVLGTAIWMVRGKGWDWNQPAANAEPATPTTEALGASSRAELEPARGPERGSSVESLPELPEDVEPVWESERERELVGSGKWAEPARRAG